MLIFKDFMLSIPVGTRALKVGGSFQASGTVVGNFKTLAGEQRYVFEFDVPAAMLHVYGPSQLQAVVERRGLE